MNAALLYALQASLIAYMHEYGGDPTIGAAAQLIGQTADREHALEHPEAHADYHIFGNGP